MFNLKRDKLIYAQKVSLQISYIIYENKMTQNSLRNRIIESNGLQFDTQTLSRKTYSVCIFEGYNPILYM